MSNTRAGPVRCTPDPWLVHCGRVAENGSLSLRDGTPLSVRSLRPEDREVLRAGIERQSPDSQYTRFFTTFPHGVPRKVLDNLVDRVDGVNYIALVLLAPGDERIGVGRLVRDPHMPDSAEISIAIDDAWQGKGAGTALGHALTREARRQGIDFVTASVRIANNRALALLASLGVVRSRQLAEPGVYDLEVFIESAGDEGDVPVPADEASGARTAESPAESADAGTSRDPQRPVATNRPAARRPSPRQSRRRLSKP
jgi:RimJ/RimL family protein N-acetyltransferase